MLNTFVIDCFPDSVYRYNGAHAIVAIDVIRATTTAVTAAAAGRRCFPVSSLEAAFIKAGQLAGPLLVGELRGDMPKGFHMNNSPAELEERVDTHRPVVLLSTSGTQLICYAAARGPTFIACFRNYRATARYLAGLYPRVAIIGAGSRSEFREEDQICCAWIAELLRQSGYVPGNQMAIDVMDRWRGATPSACLGGNSAAYLIRSGQSRDLEFILSRIDDIDAVFCMAGDEVRTAPASQDLWTGAAAATAHRASVAAD